MERGRENEREGGKGWKEGRGTEKVGARMTGRPTPTPRRKGGGGEKEREICI